MRLEVLHAQFTGLSEAKLNAAAFQGAPPSILQAASCVLGKGACHLFPGLW